jgi:lipid II:glycine glycyltransferase (peptidoglycan interpeptide bridge formation enzyme)
MEIQENLENFIQFNSPDGGFLQSDEWRKFQEAVGRKNFNISIPHPNPLPQAGEGDFGFWANIIEHQLPIVGKYFYIPRGPIIQSSDFSFHGKSGNSSKPSFFRELINLAKENKAGWVRIEPANNEILEIIKKIVGTNFKFVRSPHDMQPKEILVIDITKSEEELLVEMKQKTRYNIKLAEKKGVKVSCIMYNVSSIDYFNRFIELVKITAERDKITPHPESYYRKMFETIPDDILKLYVAEYQGEIIAANLMIFYGKTATYLHGASDNQRRNLMAPYLLQWQAIRDAKKNGCEKYDLGGINTKTGEGITKFKLGFAPYTKPVEFPGSWDIMINLFRYRTYRIIQKFKSLLR